MQEILFVQQIIVCYKEIYILYVVFNFKLIFF